MPELSIIIGIALAMLAGVFIGLMFKNDWPSNGDEDEE